MLVPLLIVVQINWDSVDGSRWILLGGSTGSESQPDKSTSDIVSLVTLEQDSQYVDPTKWCSKNLASLPMELDGSAASWVDTRSFLASQLGNSSFSTAHHTTAFAGGLVCGGADREYRISRACWWYFPATDKWKKGPRQSGPPSLVQNPPDTVLSLVEPYYAVAKVYALNTKLKTSRCPLFRALYAFNFVTLPQKESNIIGALLP